MKTNNSCKLDGKYKKNTGILKVKPWREIQDGRVAKHSACLIPRRHQNYDKII